LKRHLPLNSMLKRSLLRMSLSLSCKQRKKSELRRRGSRSRPKPKPRKPKRKSRSNKRLKLSESWPRNVSLPISRNSRSRLRKQQRSKRNVSD